MARTARLALADARALDIEGERQNPISGGNYADIGKKAVALHRAEHRLLGHGKGNEAHYQGYALGRHLKRLHGGAFHHSFTEGVMGGGLYDTDNDDDKEQELDERQNFVGGGRVVGAGRDRDPENNPVGFGLMDTVRELKKKYPNANKNPMGEMKYDAHSMLKGKGTGAYEGMGHCVGGKSGGKRKPGNNRFEVVRKVMKEKGLSMIEASKYVKANGLY